MINYITNLFSGIWALMKGMYITMLNFLRPKVTEQYPENRGKKQMFERFRGELYLPHNENNEHKCTACGICQNSCPNHTITVVTKQITTEDGKTKKALDKYFYDIGSCTFCDLCYQSCPFNALAWSQNFEHSVFTRTAMVKKLNKEGSKLAEKKAPVAPAPSVKTENTDKIETKIQQQ
jgi:NADH-quinone oxidoreductase subunit I